MAAISQLSKYRLQRCVKCVVRPTDFINIVQNEAAEGLPSTGKISAVQRMKIVTGDKNNDI